MANIMPTYWTDSIMHLVKNKVLFHQDSARVQVHTCLVSMVKFHELGYELLPHLPYSPDLASIDYFLFANLKKLLGGKRFDSNNEIISQTNTYFEDLDKSYFLEGIKKTGKTLNEVYRTQRTLC